MLVIVTIIIATITNSFRKGKNKTELDFSAKDDIQVRSSNQKPPPEAISLRV